jgi:hypothetical protein
MTDDNAPALGGQPGPNGREPGLSNSEEMEAVRRTMKNINQLRRLNGRHPYDYAELYPIACKLLQAKIDFDQALKRFRNID